MEHVNNWFEYDPFCKDSASYKSLKKVRNYHRTVGQLMDNIENPYNISGYKWLNQYSMNYAQFSFVGLMAVFPKEVSFTQMYLSM